MREKRWLDFSTDNCRDSIDHLNHKNVLNHVDDNNVNHHNIPAIDFLDKVEHLNFDDKFAIESLFEAVKHYKKHVLSIYGYGEQDLSMAVFLDVSRVYLPQRIAHLKFPNGDQLSQQLMNFVKLVQPKHCKKEFERYYIAALQFAEKLKYVNEYKKSSKEFLKFIEAVKPKKALDKLTEEKEAILKKCNNAENIVLKMKPNGYDRLYKKLLAFAEICKSLGQKQIICDIAAGMRRWENVMLFLEPPADLLPITGLTRSAFFKELLDSLVTVAKNHQLKESTRWRAASLLLVVSQVILTFTENSIGDEMIPSLVPKKIEALKEFYVNVLNCEINDLSERNLEEIYRIVLTAFEAQLSVVDFADMDKKVAQLKIAVPEKFKEACQLRKVAQSVTTTINQLELPEISIKKIQQSLRQLKINDFPAVGTFIDQVICLIQKVQHLLDESGMESDRASMTPTFLFGLLSTGVIKQDRQKIEKICVMPQVFPTNRSQIKGLELQIFRKFTVPMANFHLMAQKMNFINSELHKSLQNCRAEVLFREFFFQNFKYKAILLFFFDRNFIGEFSAKFFGKFNNNKMPLVVDIVQGFNKFKKFISTIQNYCLSALKDDPKFISKAHKQHQEFAIRFLSLTYVFNHLDFENKLVVIVVANKLMHQVLSHVKKSLPNRLLNKSNSNNNNVFFKKSDWFQRVAKLNIIYNWLDTKEETFNDFFKNIFPKSKLHQSILGFENGQKEEIAEILKKMHNNFNKILNFKKSLYRIIGRCNKLDERVKQVIGPRVRSSAQLFIYKQPNKQKEVRGSNKIRLNNK